jgi:hypothetical protein
VAPLVITKPIGYKKLPVLAIAILRVSKLITPSLEIVRALVQARIRDAFRISRMEKRNYLMARCART